MEIPFDDLDPDSVGGFETLAPGWAHLEVLDAQEGMGPKGSMVVNLECLRHSVPNQEGKAHRELFWVDFSKPTARKKFLAFALATGLTTIEEVKALAAQGKSPNIDYTKAAGKQIVAKFSTWNDFVSINFDNIYHPANSKAEACPLHAAKLKFAGIVLPEGRNIDGVLAAAKPAGASAKPNPSAQAANIDSLMKGI